MTGAAITLALTDPDTNGFLPDETPRFGGQLATVSQGDGKIIFASHLDSTQRLTTLSMTDSVAGNVPPIDGLAMYDVIVAGVRCAGACRIAGIACMLIYSLAGMEIESRPAFPAVCGSGP